MADFPKIKICGITRPADAALAADLGASFIGMIFCPESRRCISQRGAEEVIAALASRAKRAKRAERASRSVLKVGVFMNDDRARVMEIAGRLKLDLVQLHGDESPEYCSSIPMPVIKAFSIGQGFDPGRIRDYIQAVRYLLFDAFDRGIRGGTGSVFDWGSLEALKNQASGKGFFMAGGLSPDNIRDAAGYGPFGLDVNSGVESVPGVKDETLMKRLFGVASGS